MAEQKYSSYEAFKEDFEGNILLINAIGNIDLFSSVYEMSMEEQLASFQLVYTSRVTLLEEHLASLKEITIFKNEKEKERHLLRIQFAEEGLQHSQKNLEVLAEITRLFHEDETLPFEKNKTYTISDWNLAFCGCTGEQIEDIKSSKLKVLENSKFKNAYDAFILGVTSHPFPKDESGLPFFQVKPSYGSWKSSLFVRMDMIETD